MDAVSPEPFIRRDTKLQKPQATHLSLIALVDITKKMFIPLYSPLISELQFSTNESADICGPARQLVVIQACI